LCLKAQCAALSLCVCLCEQTRCSAGCAALSPGRPSPLNMAACVGAMHHKAGKSSCCRWHTRTPRWLLPDLHTVTASVHLLLGYELCQTCDCHGVPRDPWLFNCSACMPAHARLRTDPSSPFVTCRPRVGTACGLPHAPCTGHVTLLLCMPWASHGWPFCVYVHLAVWRATWYACQGHLPSLSQHCDCKHTLTIRILYLYIV
jgi:hypothetical protein